MNSNNRDRKKDIICIWKEFPYLGDVRDTSVLEFFSNYKMYEDEVRLMAQMRVILMSNYLYQDMKPYLTSIMHDDSKIYQFVKDATEFYITNVKPKHKGEKDKLEYYTESIMACIRKNTITDDDVRIY